MRIYDSSYFYHYLFNFYYRSFRCCALFGSSALCGTMTTSKKTHTQTETNSCSFAECLAPLLWLVVRFFFSLFFHFYFVCKLLLLLLDAVFRCGVVVVVFSFFTLQWKQNRWRHWIYLFVCSSNCCLRFCLFRVHPIETKTVPFSWYIYFFVSLFLISFVFISFHPSFHLALTVLRHSVRLLFRCDWIDLKRLLVHLVDYTSRHSSILWKKKKTEQKIERATEMK